jgi:two-component system chemotaxis response regulator CheV
MNWSNALPAENAILLQSGTNEVEVLVFRVGGFTLGINVAKVREVLTSPPVTALPDSHPSICGCFRLRDSVIPCLSLHKHLDEPPSCPPDEAVVILTEFNQHQIGFLVDVVERIHRISWSNVMAAPTIIAQSKAPVTAVSQIDGRLILMLDFEMIADQVALGEQQGESIANELGVERAAQRVAIVDDSATARNAVESTLRQSGYNDLHIFENGAEAWNWLAASADQRSGRPPIDLLISDVEMPQVDGFHLTKRIKEHPQLREIPVLLYSSILTPDNAKKGKAVLADAQIAKPELHRVVEMADKLIFAATERKNVGSPASTTREPELAGV